jgi:hypothetical protein
MEGGPELPSGEIVMSQKLEEQMKLLLEKVDRVLSLLEKPPDVQHRETKAPRTRKQKAAPLSAEEMANHQARFESLFEIWNTGEEVHVENQLGAIDAHELRRFADANNLNVTSKTPKQKVMQLIAGRFRERRQLMRSHFSRPPPTE